MLMVCAFVGRPRVLRVYGRGEVHLPGSLRWAELRPIFPGMPGGRQIITVGIDRVATSCGYGVPLMELGGPRGTLTKWAESKGEEGLASYRREKNRRSIDGLPTPLGADPPPPVRDQD